MPSIDNISGRIYDSHIFRYSVLGDPNAITY